MKKLLNLHYLLVILAIVSVSHTAFSQTKFIENVRKKGNELVIPYEKYQLANGLTLIIHEDHSDPLVKVDVTYHVGSAREEIGKSGFAHFFEHMMFQGSENVKDEEHFKIITEAGGTLNGTTNRDRTNYFETVPSNQLELMLWLEADRMGFLLNAVTQKKFEVQRATVKNEKGQSYDNRPYGRWREVNAAALYPYGHPYSWLTIGKLEDLNRVDVNDLKRFFMRWYGPNNATVTVGGDVKPKQVIKLVEKYFGPIKAGPSVKNMQLPAVKLDKDRYVSYVDRNIRFPALLVTYPSVPQYSEDEAALDCLAGILGTGRKSYFYNKFVKTRKAIQASVFHNNSELAGEFTMFVLPFPGTTLANFEKQMREALKEFEKNGVTDEDVQKFKAQYESRTINSLASVSGKVAQLAAYQTFTGNPNQIKKQLKKYTSLTKEDVMRAYNKYIKGKFAVYQSVLPKTMKGMAAQKDNFKPQTEGKNPFPTTNYSGLTYKRPTDNFNRGKRPVPGQAPLVNVPEFWKAELNGIKVIGTKSDEIPTVTLQFSIKGGQKLDANNLKKVGLASLTSSMMNEATQKYTSTEVSEELRKLGSNISFFSDDGNTYIQVNSLKKNLSATLKLLEEKLLRPRFDERDFKRVKKQALEGAKASSKQPQAIANNVYRKLLYTDKDVRRYPTSGTELTILNITLDDVKKFYADNYSPSVTQLVVVGDVSQNDIMDDLKFLNNWKKKKVKINKLPKPAKIDKTKIYLVDKQSAPQSEIRIGYMTNMKYDATGEYYKSYLMNYPLGGAFNSRINLNLREDKGYTYGARSFFSSDEDPGPFTASAGVRRNVTDSSVVEFMKEIKGYYKGGITKEELEFLKKSIGQRDARSYETPFQKASFLDRILTYDLDKDFVTKQKKIIDKIKKKEINALIKKHVNPEKMNILVVGDKASIEPGLKKIGYEVVELDADGKKVDKKAKKESQAGGKKKD